jgi:hypothetical protein
VIRAARSVASIRVAQTHLSLGPRVHGAWETGMLSGRAYPTSREADEAPGNATELILGVGRCRRREGE